MHTFTTTTRVAVASPHSKPPHAPRPRHNLHAQADTRSVTVMADGWLGSIASALLESPPSPAHLIEYGPAWKPWRAGCQANHSLPRDQFARKTAGQRMHDWIDAVQYRLSDTKDAFSLERRHY
jgi:hypothetical protein